jgi:uncharacterized protein YkwD
MRSLRHRHGRLFGTLATACVLALPGTARAWCPGQTLRPSSSNLDTIRSATLCLINAKRAEHGLDPLRENARLTDASNTYSRAMVRRHFFGHVDPQGNTIADRLFAAGYLRAGARRWLTGENIMWAQTSLSTPARIVAGWMRSPSHRENVLESQFREIGLGVALGSPRGDPADKAATYTTDFGMVDVPAHTSTRKLCARRAANAAKAVKGKAARRKTARRILKRCLRTGR